MLWWIKLCVCDTELSVGSLSTAGGHKTHYSLRTQLRGTYYQRRINSGPRRLITRERFGLGLDHGRSAWLLVSGQPAGHCWRSRRVSGDVTCRQCDRSQCRAPVCMAFPPLPRHLLPRAGPPQRRLWNRWSSETCVRTADRSSTDPDPQTFNGLWTHLFF